MLQLESYNNYYFIDMEEESFVLAEHLIRMAGKKVIGSDLQVVGTPARRRVAVLGGRILVKHDGIMDERIYEAMGHADVVIYPASCPEDYSELTRGRELGLPLFSVQELRQALAAKLCPDVPEEKVPNALRDLRGPMEHSMDLVREIDGVKYINDSYATDLNETCLSLSTAQAPVILIAGGFIAGGETLKGIETFLEQYREKIRHIILIGSYAEGIERLLREAGISEITVSENLKEGLQSAAGMVQKGDTVLFSPFRPSWDQYKTYKERGEHFRELVKDI